MVLELKDDHEVNTCSKFMVKNLDQRSHMLFDVSVIAFELLISIMACSWQLKNDNLELF